MSVKYKGTKNLSTWNIYTSAAVPRARPHFAIKSGRLFKRCHRKQSASSCRVLGLRDSLMMTSLISRLSPRLHRPPTHSCSHPLNATHSFLPALPAHPAPFLWLPSSSHSGYQAPCNMTTKPLFLPSPSSCDYQAPAAGVSQPKPLQAVPSPLLGPARVTGDS